MKKNGIALVSFAIIVMMCAGIAYVSLMAQRSPADQPVSALAEGRPSFQHERILRFFGGGML